jgi:hypothetical protein
VGVAGAVGPDVTGCDVPVPGRLDDGVVRVGAGRLGDGDEEGRPGDPDGSGLGEDGAWVGDGGAVDGGGVELRGVEWSLLAVLGSGRITK